MMIMWAVIGLVIYYLYKNNASVGMNLPKQQSSMDVLKQRYVNSEIDDETYEKMKKIIQE